jgi:hypothetical protein
VITRAGITSSDPAQFICLRFANVTCNGIDQRTLFSLTRSIFHRFDFASFIKKSQASFDPCYLLGNRSRQLIEFLSGPGNPPLDVVIALRASYIVAGHRDDLLAAKDGGQRLQ